MLWPSWLSHCLLTGWTKEATAENKRSDDEIRRHKERQKYGMDVVDAAPGEDSAERQCRGVGPSVNVGPYTITRGRRWRRGRDGNNATWDAADNDGKSGCQHDNDDNCDGRPPLNQNV